MAKKKLKGSTMAKTITCIDCVQKIKSEAQKDYIVPEGGTIQQFDVESYLEIEQHCLSCGGCEEYKRSCGI